MNQLRDDLDRRATLFAPNPQALDRVLRRASRRRTVRRLTAGVVALGIALVAFAALWSISRPARLPVATVAPSPESPESARDLSIGLSTKVAGWIVLADPFGVRVAGAGTLTMVDPATGEQRPAGDGGWDYDYAKLAEYGEGTIFVASGQAIWEVASDGSTISRTDVSDLGSITDLVAIGSAQLWISSVDGLDGWLSQIDPDTGEKVASYPVGGGHLAEAGGFLFVEATDGTNAVNRIDPSTGAATRVADVSQGSMAGIGDHLWIAQDDLVRCINAVDLTPCGDTSVPRAVSLASDGSDLWVLSSDGSKSEDRFIPDPDVPATVSLIDGASGRVLGDPIDLPETTPATISAFGGQAWVGFHDSGRLVRIDTSPGNSASGGGVDQIGHESFPVSGPVSSIAAGDGWVWLSTNNAGIGGEGAFIDKVDPTTGEVVAAIPVADAPSYLAAGGGSVWAPITDPKGNDPVLLQVDAETNSITRRFPGISGPVVLATDGTVWAIGSGATDNPEIQQLDPATRSIITRLPVDSVPVAMVEAAGSLWALPFPDDRPGSGELLRIDAATGSVVANIDVGSDGIWLAGNDQGVWLSSSFPGSTSAPSEGRGNSRFVSASDNSVTAFGNIYNFRPFAVSDGYVWFIAGPHDGPIQGTCALNIETQVVDACSDDGVGVDLEVARNPGAYEPGSGTVWTGMYLKSMVTRGEWLGG